MNILQMMMGACGGVTWANWDEAAESTLASDDIFVCLMENVNAGGDETGQGGGLTGANLVLTQSGNVAGATGSPPSRVLDGSDDCLKAPTGMLDALICNSNKTWTIILKISNITIADDYFFYISDAAENELLNARIATNDTIITIEQDNTLENHQTTDAILTATTYYLALWADGTDMRYGFTTTRPTKWSDFDAGKRYLFLTNTGDYNGETFDHATYRDFFCAAASSYLACTAHYIVMAKTCLIDNDL